MVYVNKQTLEDMKKWKESEAPMVYRFQDFQNDVSSTANYPKRGEEAGLLYLIAGLAGEVGELTSKIAKCIRDYNGVFNDERVGAISKEIGDSLWMLTDICTHFGLKLEDVAIENREKLRDRMERGVLGGSGDNR